jgi:hypothetical protein
MQFQLLTTRFTDETYLQNKDYKRKKKLYGCIYGSPVRMKNTIPMDGYCIILEMNNTSNQIEGIGVVKNKIHVDKKYNIYEDRNYNRYIYKGKTHIKRDDITDEYEKNIMNVLDTLLFKGYKHLKRGQGFTELPSWIIHNKHNYDFIANIINIINKYSSVDNSRIRTCAGKA